MTGRLAGRFVGLGITGSIAAYKAVDNCVYDRVRHFLRPGFYSIRSRPNQQNL